MSKRESCDQMNQVISVICDSGRTKASAYTRCNSINKISHSFPSFTFMFLLMFLDLFLLFSCVENSTNMYNMGYFKPFPFLLSGGGCKAAQKFGWYSKMPIWSLCCPLLVRRCLDASHQPHWRKFSESMKLKQSSSKSERIRTSRYG